MAILMRNKSTVYGLTTDLTTLQTNIDNEVTRAKGVEGLLADLNTSDKATLVAAINAEMSRATTLEGLLADLTTSDKSTLVAAVNSEVLRAKTLEGALADLTTADKSTLVAAVNSEVSRAKGVEGVLADLATTDKSTLVAAINEVKSSGADAFSTFYTTEYTPLDTLVNTINGDSTTVGSFRKAIADVIDLAPDALNTLKEIADYINVNPNANVADAIVNSVTDAVNALKGAVTAANDTLEELEINLNAEVTRATGVEGTLSSLTTSSKVDLVSAINALATDSATALSDAIAQEVIDRDAAILVETNARKAADGDLTTLTTSVKTDLVAAINAEVADRKANASIPALEMLTVASNKIVLSAAPQNGIGGVLNFATVRFVDNDGIAYDAPVSVDVADATGKTLIISVDTSGQWDAKSVAVQYLRAIA